MEPARRREICVRFWKFFLVVLAPLGFGKLFCKRTPVHVRSGRVHLALSKGGDLSTQTAIGCGDKPSRVDEPDKLISDIMKLKGKKNLQAVVPHMPDGFVEYRIYIDEVSAVNDEGDPIFNHT
ncbi:hypothetical protein AAMO2058_001430200, partial [Amorphochlora amoebiformis]